MNKNYETVFIILEKLNQVPIFIENGTITPDDIEIAIEYLREQKLVSEEKLIEIIDEIQECTEAYIEISDMFQNGMSEDEIKKIIDKDGLCDWDEIK